MMNNKQLAGVFTLIANLLEIKGEIIYKTLAYRKAAESLDTLGREASEYWKEGKLADTSYRRSRETNWGGEDEPLCGQR